MSKQVEKSILGLLVAGAMLITLGAGVVVYTCAIFVAARMVRLESPAKSSLSKTQRVVCAAWCHRT